MSYAWRRARAIEARAAPQWPAHRQRPQWARLAAAALAVPAANEPHTMAPCLLPQCQRRSMGTRPRGAPTPRTSCKGCERMQKYKHTPNTHALNMIIPFLVKHVTTASYCVSQAWRGIVATQSTEHVVPPLWKIARYRRSLHMGSDHCHTRRDTQYESRMGAPSPDSNNKCYW